MSAKAKTSPTKTASKTKPPAKKRGNMSPGEITPLVMAARKAYDIQREYGNMADGVTFDTWRKAQCLEAVSKPGLTACNHHDFRPLLAHFQTLAGDDAAAFKSLMRSGKPTDHAAPGDTHEERATVAATIADILAAHMHLANTSADQLLAEAKGVHEIYQSGVPWETSTTATAFRVMLARKAAITAKGKGPLTVGYVLHLTRQKTRRPDLTLGQNWQAGIAERCTVKQLDQIRSTIVNRIAAVEGLGTTLGRNKSQRSPSAKAARDKNQIEPRW